jgi:hypothetical protein
VGISKLAGGEINILEGGINKIEGVQGGLVVVVPKFTHNVRCWLSGLGNR